MIYKYLIVLLFLPISVHQASGQNRDTTTSFYTGIRLEYSTLIITQNIKLFSNLNIYRNEKIIMNLQPGFEFLYSLPGAERTFYPESPYYDINFLGDFDFYPNYGISINPFVGISYRLDAQEYEDDNSFFYLKYGATLNLNVAIDFKVIGKIMNVPTFNDNDTEFFIGVGISFKLF
jgi:hypothetical protein